MLYKLTSLYVIIFIGIQRKFTISPTNPAIDKLRGEPFKFICRYAIPNKQLGWMMFGVGDTMFRSIPRSRITTVKNAAETVEELYFQKVTLNDTGTYRCTVQENGKVRETAKRILQVRGE